jgi:hypothetical protein
VPELNVQWELQKTAFKLHLLKEGIKCSDINLTFALSASYCMEGIPDITYKRIKS